MQMRPARVARVAAFGNWLSNMNEFSRKHPRAPFLQMCQHHEMAAADVDDEVIAGRLALVRLANFIVVQIADAFRDFSIRRSVKHLPPRRAGIEHTIGRQLHVAFADSFHIQ
jgi:hypothetical protein